MGWPFLAENRRRRKKREIDLFAKWPFSRLCAHFFGHPSRKSFFVNSGQLSSGNTSVEVDTRETLQNKGFRSDFAALYLFEHFGCVETASFCGPLLRIIFSVGYYFLRFHVRNFVEIGFPSSKFLKKTLGLQNRARFEKHIFRSVSAARANLARRGCAAVPFFFGGFRVPVKNGLAAAVRRVFSSFPVFFLTPFSKTSSGPLHIPLFFFGCFSLLFAFFLGFGATPALHICFWAVGLQPFLSFGGFWGLLRKTLFFPLKKGYLGSFLSVSLLCLPFVRLAFFHFSLSLSLSLYLYLFLSLFFSFLIFSSLLSYLYFYLPCFLLLFLVLLLRFCFMRRTTSKYYIWKFAFHSLFCLFFCFVFQICSYLCFSLFNLCVMVNINVSNYSKKTISKTPILVLHIVKGYRFL